MNNEEAKEIIKHHALDGIAYTSRFWEYPGKDDLAKLLAAMEVVSQSTSGKGSIEKEVEGWIVTISDQTQGNFNGAISKNIELKTDFSKSDLIKIFELAYEVFEV